MSNKTVRDRLNQKDMADYDANRNRGAGRFLPERVERFCQLLAEIYRAAGEPCH